MTAGRRFHSPEQPMGTTLLTSCLLFLKDAGDLLRSSHNRRPSLGLRTPGQGGLRKRHMQLKDEREWNFHRTLSVHVALWNVRTDVVVPYSKKSPMAWMYQAHEKLWMRSWQAVPFVLTIKRPSTDIYLDVAYKPIGTRTCRTKRKRISLADVE